MLQNAVRVQGPREDRALSVPMSVQEWSRLMSVAILPRADRPLCALDAMMPGILQVQDKRKKDLSFSELNAKTGGAREVEVEVEREKAEQARLQRTQGSSAHELAIERWPGTATSRVGQPLQRRRSAASPRGNR